LNGGPDQLAGDGFHDNHPLSHIKFSLSRGGVLYCACVVFFTITRLWIRCVSASLVTCAVNTSWLIRSRQFHAARGYAVAVSLKPCPNSGSTTRSVSGVFFVQRRVTSPACLTNLIPLHTTNCTNVVASTYIS
jgi:hypothetical protein